MTEIDQILPEQNAIKIPIIIKGIEKDSGEWEENTNIITLSKNSMGFTLNRKCQIGHLLCLANPADSESESSKQNLENCSAWAIIQQCAALPSENTQSENYHVGVALIGDAPPISFFENPSQYYRLSGLSNSGFWIVEETAKEFISRKHPRFFASVEVYLALLDDSLNLAEGEKVLTENISFGGAAVFSNLKVEVGDCVKFISAKFEFSALAVVRNLTQYANGKQKIHLEFSAGRFPLEKLTL